MARFKLTEEGLLSRPLAPSKIGVVVNGTKNGLGWRLLFDGTFATKIIPKSHVILLEEFALPLKSLVRPYEGDNMNSFDDLRRRFARDWVRANPKQPDIIISSENINVFRAYEKLTKTGYYESIAKH